jgi:NAD(P)H-dependent FMN reductase
LNRLAVIALSGSLRAESSHASVLRACAILGAPAMSIEVFDGLARLPAFNPDLDGHEPPEVVEFQSRVRAAAGVIICSPEYAHGVPGALKNALDWLVSTDAVFEKPVALLNLSPRSTWAQASLAETLRVMNARLVEAACAAFALPGKGMSPAHIAADPATAPVLRAALAAIAAAARTARPGG